MPGITQDRKRILSEQLRRPEVTGILDKIQQAQKTGNKAGLLNAPLRPENVAKKIQNAEAPRATGKLKFLPQEEIKKIAATGRVASALAPASLTSPSTAPSSSAETISGDGLAITRRESRESGQSDRVGTLTAMSVLSGLRFGYGVTSKEAVSIRNVGARRWLIEQIDFPDPKLGSNLRGARELSQVHNRNPGGWEGVAIGMEEWRSEMAQRYYNISIAATPFMARLAEFWHQHFGVIGYIDPLDQSPGVVRQAHHALGFYKDVVLSNITGKFEDMLLASSDHPAMISHLNGFFDARQRDANGNYAPNQNYARELMQLHSVSNDPRNYRFPVEQNLLTDANMQTVFHTTDRSSIIQNGALPLYGVADIVDVALLLGGRYGYETREFYPDGRPTPNFWQYVIDQAKIIYPGLRSTYPGGWGDGGMLNRDIYVGFLNFRVGSYQLRAPDGTPLNRQINGSEQRDNLYAPGNILGTLTESMRRLFRRLANHPATATFICAKMIHHFIAADPYSPEMKPLLKEMVRAWIAGGGKLPDVYRAMINHALSFSMDERIAKPVFKDPLQFVVSINRTLETLDAFAAINGGSAAPPLGQADKARILSSIIDAAKAMGMQIDKAPTVQGWLMHSNDYWKTPGTVIQRVEYAMQMAEERINSITPQNIYTRLLASRLSASANSRAILADGDPIRALAAVLIAPEFQYN